MKILVHVTFPCYGCLICNKEIHSKGNDNLLNEHQEV